MIKIRNKVRQIVNQLTLAEKIRYSFFGMLIPLVFVSILFLANMVSMNRTYEEMINSTAVSSEFSLDFKKDFDYEAYLLIVENKTIEESKLNQLLLEANRVVSDLEEITDSKENIDRIKSIKKYLASLDTYKARIEENLKIGNKYEENKEIWENDIQIVTTLVQDEMNNYINYEIRTMQESRAVYQNSIVVLMWILIMVYVIIISVVWYLAIYIPSTITRPISQLNEVTNKVAQGDLSVRSDVHEGIEVSQLSESINSMIDKINELLEQVKTEQISLRKAEFNLLQSQINPHFLYNTLDAIVWLAESGEEKKVVSMVRSLSEFFRTSLNQGKDMVTIREEILHVKSYLEIQQTRYLDIMKYDIDISDRLNEYMIPKITLQPLVENALYHGIKNKRGMGTITITSEAKEDYYIIRIKDDGIGIEEERLAEIRRVISQKEREDSDIYGLFNVHERIALNFGDEYGVSIESTYKEGTTVEVKLPYAM